MLILAFFCLFIVCTCLFLFFFFFSSRRRHTRLQGDWSSDVCSSDLGAGARAPRRLVPAVRPGRAGPSYPRRLTRRSTPAGRDGSLRPPARGVGLLDRKSVV